VYPEKIDGLKRDYEKLWGEASKVLQELSELQSKTRAAGFACRLSFFVLMTTFAYYDIDNFSI